MEPIVPILIGGQWQEPEVDEYSPVYNPSSGEPIARTPACGSAEVERAVEAATRAFATWSQTPAPKRAEVMFALRQLLKEQFDELSRLICRENGKTLEEAKGDVQRGLEVVEFACGIAHLGKGETLPQLADGLDAATMREPLGVCVGITPFNFPAMVPMWMFPIALACGNSFILKPSQKVPLTANRLGELLQAAGLPDGVFNVVHGGAEAVEALCTHEGVAAVSFVGSSAVAKYVYATACAAGKRVQAAGGAKNLLLVLPDAEMDSSVRAIMGAAFGCAGQRCMAGSLLMGVGEAGGRVREAVLAQMAAVKVGDPLEDANAAMGPLIDAAARDRVFERIAAAPAEGLNVTLDGREGVPQRGFFAGPTLLDGVTPGHGVFAEEIFGPLLSMAHPQSLDEAIDWVNNLPYGNGATVFTRSGAAARHFARRIQCGMVGVNLGVPAPMALFPFSGWNGSFYGDLHVQGSEGVMFYTRQKIVLSRWDDAYVRQQGW